MFQNYFKIALRNLLKQKFYTIINVAGLTLGISCCLLIFLFVQNELSYDKFHAKGDRVYRVLRVAAMNGEEGKIPYTSGPYGRALVTDFPEDIQASVRVMPGNTLVTIGNKSFQENQIVLADSNFFQVFSFPLVKGDAKTALAGPDDLVISEELAKKYFGTENPIGKLVQLDKTETGKITGVMANVPENSHLKFDMVASLKAAEKQEWFYVWRNNALYTYVLLPPATQVPALEAKFPAFMDKYMSKEFKEWGGKTNLELQPLPEIYLAGGTIFDGVEHGSRTNVYMFSAIALFILVIACINFMNLASARSVGRAKEVGVRKVLGAYKKHLIAQFLSESTLLAFVSVVLSVGLIALVMPYFNALAEKNLAVPFADVRLYLFLLGVAVLVGLLAGSYPAFFLSAFQPVKVLKGRLTTGAGNPVMRKTLVVFQFSISIFLIIGTAVIFRQMHYMQNKNLGFTKEQVIKMPLSNGEIREREQTFISRVKQLAGVKNISVMSGEPGGFHDRFSFDVPEKPNEKWSFRTVFTDYDYLPTMGIKLIAGRNISKAFPTDSTKAIILNESAAKHLGWTPTEAIGKEIEDQGFGTDIHNRRKVVGVVQDYHFSSLKDPIEPMVIMMRNDHRVAAIRLAPGNPKEALAAISKVYAETAPQYPFEYTFLDEEFAKLYRTEQKQAQIFTVFSILAIFIACLGLFGLASYTTEQRRKEIGIRKILGASTGGIVSLLSLDFLKLVLLANLLAWPLAWYAMHQWLANFSYRINMGAAIFVLAGVVALIIAIITISFQAVRVAVANPVNALREE
ncbi:ABC transporter permease [Adhaeribacter aerolatus]|uniref:ABC transporter permease n=1 Tax=Adhaeribacter aerolatus TaxID=670289 RepID=A0A512B4R3_9BACT|nr:ABC transporter permease [Adhaeribacter aerolatus]GEO06950.1 ABC transporter permease [Adhaeribacter aerolatus]